MQKVQNNLYKSQLSKPIWDMYVPHIKINYKTITVLPVLEAFVCSVLSMDLMSGIKFRLSRRRAQNLSLCTKYSLINHKN